ncbi:MAG: Tex family protein [Gemmatimonadota bacterium]
MASALVSTVARELALPVSSVERTLELFGEGNTLPFIARYRKEVTGGLDEVQLRDVRDRAQYLTELEERRAAVLKSIAEQGKLDDALKAKIVGAGTKQVLEDLYLPFKPKRRTRATIARERGLGPLAEQLWAGALDDAGVRAAAAAFVDEAKEVADVDVAVQGAKDILAEQVAEDAAVRGWIREVTRTKGAVKSARSYGRTEEHSKFSDYFDFRESLGTIPSHRVLAIRRGETEGELVWSVDAPVVDIVPKLQRDVTGTRKAVTLLAQVADDAYGRLLAPSIEVELRLELKVKADEEAIAIFGRNLEQLLLSAPAGEKSVLGLDPGFRTGVKIALVSRTGALQHTDTLYLHQEDRFAATIRAIVSRFKPELIAIGNGTASRETETLVRATLRELEPPAPTVVVVSEAGASVYSASDVAREEFPELDVSIRGAVSIARRLQDPLAELVKIDPKSIGVGQYQHDVNQPKLRQRLDDIVESCVNRVGVEVNTASAQLLAYVSGVGPALAQSIVATRDAKGGFTTRKELQEVPRLGAKAFEQAGGFLRVRGGTHPLDGSAVHPERYALVARIAKDRGVSVQELIGNDAVLSSLDLAPYVSADVGMPTLQDIVAELRKPGRDPRESFVPPAFRDDVTEPKHLSAGMVLEGVVTNIVAFGAFVDIGVHQDGLVHVSQLSDRFVKDPNDVVQVGQKVTVTVQGVDLARNRIALTMKTGAKPAAAEARAATPRAPRAPAPAPTAPVTPGKGYVAPNGIRFR